MLSTLGVITGLLIIGALLYFLYFRTSAEKKFHFDIISLFKKQGNLDPTLPRRNTTYLPNLLSFVVESTGQVYDIHSIPKHGLTIGRSSPSDIIINTPNGKNCFSAEHFIICKDEHGYFLNVDQKAHLKNGIRLEPDLNSPKIKSSIDITHKLKIYIGIDSVTFFLPDYDDNSNSQSRTIINDRCTRRQ